MPASTRRDGYHGRVHINSSHGSFALENKCRGGAANNSARDTRAVGSGCQTWTAWLRTRRWLRAAGPSLTARDRSAPCCRQSSRPPAWQLYIQTRRTGGALSGALLLSSSFFVCSAAALGHDERDEADRNRDEKNEAESRPAACVCRFDLMLVWYVQVVSPALCGAGCQCGLVQPIRATQGSRG